MLANDIPENTSRSSLKYAYILLFISLVCVVFSVFDGVRGTQYKPYVPFALLRDLFTISGGFISLLYIIRRKIKKSFLVLFSLQVFICFYSFFTSYFVSDKFVFVRQLTLGGGIGFWSKLLSMLCIALMTYACLFSLKEKAFKLIFKCYVYSAFIYAILTIVIYFVFPTIYHLLPRQWYGRISIGYPTQDVYVLAVSLILVLQCDINKTLSLIISFVNITCIMMQNTFTGYILIVFIFGVYFFKFGVFSKLAISTFGFGILFLVVYMYHHYDDFGNFGTLIKVKADALMMGGSDDPSFYLRLEQISLMMKSLFSDGLFMVFGYGGIGGFSVESGLYSTLAFSGFLGAIIYLATLIYFLALSIKARDFILFSIPLMYILSSISISPIYLMSTYWTFGFLLGYHCFIKRNNAIG